MSCSDVLVLNFYLALPCFLGSLTREIVAWQVFDLKSKITSYFTSKMNLLGGSREIAIWYYQAEAEAMVKSRRQRRGRLFYSGKGALSRAVTNRRSIGLKCSGFSLAES